jgi:hypothetical protein
MLEFIVKDYDIHNLTISLRNGSTMTINILSEYILSTQNRHKQIVDLTSKIKALEEANRTLRENFDFEVKKAKAEGFKAGQNESQQKWVNNDYKVITKEEYFDLQTWKDIKADILQEKEMKAKSTTMVN